MSVTFHLYTLLFTGSWGAADWLGHDIRITLHGPSYVPDRDADQFVSDLSDELPSANGYTVGGLTLSGVSVAVDAVNHRVTMTADSPSWAGTSITAYTAVLSDRDASYGGASAEPLIGYFQSDQPITSHLSDFSVPFDPAGVVRITAS